MLKESNTLHDKLLENVNYFRDKMTAAGFDIKPTQSAICAVMLYDAKLSQIYAARMQEEVSTLPASTTPVVPKDQHASAYKFLPDTKRNIWTNVLPHLLRWGKSLEC